jgi:hypothetical protein
LGPLDVRHRILTAVGGAGIRSAGDEAHQYSMMRIQSLQSKLITRGIQAADTNTWVTDWRLNVFNRGYRRIEEPNYWGDIKPCGALANAVSHTSGDSEYCFQFKAGSKNIIPATNGMFGARLLAHDIPLLTQAMPWVALTIALFAFLTRPDVLKWFGKLLSGLWGLFVGKN